MQKPYLGWGHLLLTKEPLKGSQMVGCSLLSHIQHQDGRGGLGRAHVTTLNWKSLHGHVSIFIVPASTHTEPT